jgi:hypothetical protein
MFCSLAAAALFCLFALSIAPETIFDVLDRED